MSSILGIKPPNHVNLVSSILQGAQISTDRDRLSTIQSIMQHTIDAIDAFKNELYSSFDALCGDQACQIRALQIALLTKETLPLEAEREKIGIQLNLLKNIKNQFDTSITDLKRQKREIGINKGQELRFLKKKENKEKFMQICQKYDILQKPLEEKIKTLDAKYKEKLSQLLNSIEENLSIDHRIAYLVQLYLLTKIRDQKLIKKNNLKLRKTSTSVKNLKIEGIDYPAKILHEVIPRLKSAVVKSSVKFIQSEVKKIDSPDLKKVIGSPIKVKKIHEEELPCFHMTQVVFQRVKMENIPILLKVRNYKKKPKEKNYVEIPLHNDEKSCVIVIEARSAQNLEILKTDQYVNELFKKCGDIYQMIDMVAAQHCQTSTNQSIEEITSITNEQKKEINSFKNRAIQLGFSAENQEMLCIEHIYCDRGRKNG